MIKIETKHPADPVAQTPIVNAYMQWYLRAAGEVLGMQKLHEILEDNHLEYLINHYPEDNLQLSSTLTFQDYATLNASFIQSLGEDHIDQVVQIGRISAKPALKKQGKIFNFGAKQALKLLPMATQIKTVLESMQHDIQKSYRNSGYEADLLLEDRGESWAYIDPSCALCAGKTSNTHICWIWKGSIQESLHWLTGKDFKITQVACRATKDSVCVWEVNKTPL